jgi:hypothetical protein
LNPPNFNTVNVEEPDEVLRSGHYRTGWGPAGCDKGGQTVPDGIRNDGNCLSIIAFLHGGHRGNHIVITPHPVSSLEQRFEQRASGEYRVVFQVLLYQFGFKNRTRRRGGGDGGVHFSTSKR